MDSIKNVKYQSTESSSEVRLRAKAIICTKLVAVSLITFIIVVLPFFSFFPFEIPHRFPLSAIMIVELITGVIFEIIINRRTRKGKSYQPVAYAQVAVDVVNLTIVLCLLGGFSGPLFFFYTLNIMGAAYTFNPRLPVVVGLFGIFMVDAEFLASILMNQNPFSGILLLTKIMQNLYLAFMAYYGYALSKKIISEKARSQMLGILITDLKKVNEKLDKANERLRELDHLKDAFVPIASQELKTPLTAIKNYLWMLKEGKEKSELDQKGKEFLEKVVKLTQELFEQVEKLGKIVDRKSNLKPID